MQLSSNPQLFGISQIKLKKFKALSLIFTFTLSSQLHASMCEVKTNTGCKESEVCMNWKKDETKCIEIPPTSTQIFSLPFESQTEVVCTHAGGIGSHSWSNAFWALDLATPYESEASVIRAAAPGKAFVFFGNDGKPCKNPKGTPEKAEADDCGNSWGNRIKILHEDGYYSFYVHFEKSLSLMVKKLKQEQHSASRDGLELPVTDTCTGAFKK